MNELITLFNNWRNEYSLSLEIGYTPVLDWYVEIKQRNHENYKTLFNYQSCDLYLCCTRAYIFLTDYLIKKEGGY